MEDIMTTSDLIIITQKDKAYSDIVSNNPEKIFIDLVRIAGDLGFDNYNGICW
jgi:hypothetical protein